MKKFYLLTKTLLAAVCLLVGASNAWGQVTTTLLEYGTNDVPWTEKNISAFDFTYSDVFHATVYTHTYALDGDYAKITSNRCGYVQATKTISPTTNATLNIEAEFLLNCGTGKYFSNGTASFFRFGNIWIVENDQDKKSNYLLSGSFSGSNYGTNFHSDTGYRSTGINYRLVAEINTATNTLVALNVYVNGSASASLSLSNIALSSPDYTTVEFGLFNSGHQTANPVEGLKSIKITQTTSATEYADYTVHFVDNNGATVKDDEVRNGEVGSTVNANSDDMTSFYSGGNKYVYANDGGGVEVVKAGTSEMTVTYTKYGQFTYNVYAVNSSDVKLQNDPIATATTYLTESATLAWSKYIKISGKWYVSSESTFRTTATAAGSKNVVYTETDAIDYFFEFEDLTKSGSFAATSSGDDRSNNNSARLSKSSRVWTTALAAGTYTLKIYCYGENAKSPTLSMYYCNTDGSNLVYIGEATAASASSWELKETTGIVIPDGKALCLYNTDGSNNSNYLADYITLKRTGDASTTVNLNANGYATYSTCYDVEVSGADAYTAELDFAKETITCTKIASKKVPAGNGVLLYGEPNAEVTLTVVADAAALGTNNLKATTNANGTLVTKGSNNYYSLSGDTFKKFTGAAFVHNKAYFEVTAGGEVQARSMRITFGGITGVENVEAAAEATAKKNGAYLENGKIAIYKNGMKFNAAGQLIK